MRPDVDEQMRNALPQLKHAPARVRRKDVELASNRVTGAVADGVRKVVKLHDARHAVERGPRVLGG